jgi:hypothetical protein
LIPDGLWRLLHLFFAFSYVGTLVVAEWNGRAARATTDPAQRALLFQIIRLSGRVGGLGSLVALGVFGNLTAIRLGYSMRVDVWMRWVNVLWLLALITMLAISLPNAARLADASRAGASADADRALARWRMGNVIQSVLYLALLTLMVFHWHS